MASISEKIQESVADLIDTGTHIDVADATEFIAKKLGLRDRWINYTHVEFRNKFNEIGYKRVPVKERFLFLPHCLKNSKECKADYGEDGLICKRCGKCQISELIGLAEETGFKKTFVAPGGSMVLKLIDKYKPEAVLGVCCYNEAQLAFDKLKGKTIYPQAVLLLKDGCADTRVNIEEVREKMMLGAEK